MSSFRLRHDSFRNNEKKSTTEEGGEDGAFLSSPLLCVERLGREEKKKERERERKPRSTFLSFWLPLVGPVSFSLRFDKPMERTPHIHTHTHTRLRVLHCYSFSFIACFNFIAVRYGCCATWLPVSLLPSIRPQRLNTITKAATTTTKKRHTNTPTTIHRKEKHHITTKQAKQRTNRRRTRVAREERRRVQLRSSLALRELLSHCLSTHCGASHCSDNPSTSFFFFYFGLVALSTYSNSHLGSASLIFVTPHPKKKKKSAAVPIYFAAFSPPFFLCSFAPFALLLSF